MWHGDTNIDFYIVLSKHLSLIRIFMFHNQTNIHKKLSKFSIFLIISINQYSLVFKTKATNTQFRETKEQSIRGESLKKIITRKLELLGCFCNAHTVGTSSYNK